MFIKNEILKFTFIFLFQVRVIECDWAQEDGPSSSRV